MAGLGSKRKITKETTIQKAELSQSWAEGLAGSGQTWEMLE